MKKLLLSKEKGNFYKANLHCHTVYSDGLLTPQEIKELYKSMGYSVVAFTDHNIMIPHLELCDETFLALNGYELNISETKKDFSQAKSCHINLVALEESNLMQICWHREKYLLKNAVLHRDKVQFDENEPDFERVYSPECISYVMEEGRRKGFFVTYNHPTWGMEDYNDYTNYHGMHAMEICNSGSMGAGYAEYNPRVYDDMLRAGKRIYCIAADDNHKGAVEAGGGFTVINATELKYRTITKALEDGNFYASQGPEIYELWYEDGKIGIKCSPAEQIIFNFGNRAAKRFCSENDGTIECAEAEVKDNNIYVRVTVIDHKGKPANTNAYFVDESKGSGNGQDESMYYSAGIFNRF